MPRARNLLDLTQTTTHRRASTPPRTMGVKDTLADPDEDTHVLKMLYKGNMEESSRKEMQSRKAHFHGYGCLPGSLHTCLGTICCSALCLFCAVVGREQARLVCGFRRVPYRGLPLEVVVVVVVVVVEVELLRLVLVVALGPLDLLVVLIRRTKHPWSNFLRYKIIPVQSWKITKFTNVGCACPGAVQHKRIYLYIHVVPSSFSCLRVDP